MEIGVSLLCRRYVPNIFPNTKNVPLKRLSTHPRNIFLYIYQKCDIYFIQLYRLDSLNPELHCQFAVVPSL